MKLFVVISLVCFWANTALSQEQGDGSRGGWGGGSPPPRCPPGCGGSGGSGGYPPPGGSPGWGGSGGSSGYPPKQGGSPGFGGSGGYPNKGGPPGRGGPGGYSNQGGPPGRGGPGGYQYQGGPGGPPYGGPGGSPNQGGPPVWERSGGPQHQRGPGGPPRGGPGGPPHGGPGGPPHGGRGGHRKPHGPPPNIYDMFPACASLAESMRTKQHEMMEKGQIGPGKCESQDHKECMQSDMTKVRCEIIDEPLQECSEQVMAFIQGDVCNGGEEEADGEASSDPDVDEDLPRK